MVETSETTPNPNQEPPKRKPSPFRLRRAMELLAKVASKKVTIEGKENLAQLKPDEKVIFVTTHLKDSDVPIAFTTLASDFDIAMVNISGHSSPKQDIFSYAGIKVAGSSAFLPISYRGHLTHWSPDNFQKEDFQPMQEALKKGKAVMIAAYSPTKEQILPQRPGFGAMYLAELTGATLVPITVNQASQAELAGQAGIKGMVTTVLKRPEVTVTYGEPIRPTETLDPNIPLYKQIPSLIQQQTKVMEALAQPLPLQKRGIWGKTPS